MTGAEESSAPTPGVEDPVAAAVLVYASATEALIVAAHAFRDAFDDDVLAALDAHTAAYGSDTAPEVERELLAWLDSIHPETAALAYRMAMFKQAHATLHGAARAAHRAAPALSEVPTLPDVASSAARGAPAA